MDQNGKVAAERAIAYVMVAAGMLSDAKFLEMKLEDQRPLVKSEAISRIMSLADPQNEGKLYSATAAEALVMTDEVYARHRSDQALAAARTITAAGGYEAAKLRARLLTATAEVNV